MSRLARIVVPGVPHHVKQRGHCRVAIFSEAGITRSAAIRLPGGCAIMTWRAGPIA